MIETFEVTLPNGITLACRAAGPQGAPRLVFLHGFPEAAFVWDDMLRHFGARYRCVAPNLRGYERSSRPSDVESYRAQHLVGDLLALFEHLGGPPAALVAHDWGGALAWGLAARHPQCLRRLVIVNAPHPATFLREMQHNRAQQAASAYMNFLCRADAEALLADNDYARLWKFFTNMGAADASHPGGGWLTEAAKERYREVWRLGLDGALNYYRASSLRPPTEADRSVMALRLPAEVCTVRVPTRVVWAEADTALPVSLLDGLDTFVPDLRLVRVPGATHWVVHERPGLIAAQIEAELALVATR